MLIKSENPPLLHSYGEVCTKQAVESKTPPMEECQLPLIDLAGLTSVHDGEREACAAAICRASSEWGFFQVINHGINPELLKNMRKEQMKLFQTPFNKKSCSGLLNNSYRWGNPTATSPHQFSWSEAFHIPFDKISEAACYGEFTSLREVMMEFGEAMSRLAKLLAGILAQNLGHTSTVFEDVCQETNCFLRLNRYPPCPFSPDIFGLVPHTDSDFLTILSQDQVGGLQLMNNSKWVAVKPNEDALIVNIGDLFQAWSNDVYKSVEHKVMANAKMERYSLAYFLCPSYDSLIQSCREPSIYRKFTFGEYRKQVQEDVKKTGHKLGLQRFLL
ncbi:gibberellin 2-beta-dioxygenase 6-like [Euphorbia lathyris]|uniref:gibberellin 2-beta-dioxygenase 6-like n=1 Tax=Euphorbia lathyris TaxID=212925 RepID=UPI003313742A